MKSSLITGLFFSILLLGGKSFGATAPKDGFVPDSATAIKIAEAVWFPIFGSKVMQERPFVAKLVNGVWVVEGSLAKEAIGGVALAKIEKSSGKILEVSHGQ